METLPLPDLAMHAKANQIWQSNDKSLKAFLLSHVSNKDFVGHIKMDNMLIVIVGDMGKKEHLE